MVCQEVQSAVSGDLVDERRLPTAAAPIEDGETAALTTKETPQSPLLLLTIQLTVHGQSALSESLGTEAPI